MGHINPSYLYTHMEEVYDIYSNNFYKYNILHATI